MLGQNRCDLLQAVTHRTCPHPIGDELASVAQKAMSAIGYCPERRLPRLMRNKPLIVHADSERWGSGKVGIACHGKFILFCALPAVDAPKFRSPIPVAPHLMRGLAFLRSAAKG